MNVLVAFFAEEVDVVNVHESLVAGFHFANLATEVSLLSGHICRQGDGENLTRVHGAIAHAVVAAAGEVLLHLKHRHLFHTRVGNIQIHDGDGADSFEHGVNRVGGQQVTVVHTLAGGVYYTRSPHGNICPGDAHRRQNHQTV